MRGIFAPLSTTPAVVLLRITIYPLEKLLADENLCRAELIPAQRAKAIAGRKATRARVYYVKQKGVTRAALG